MKWRHASFGIVITRQLYKQVTEILSGSLPREILIAPMGVQTTKFARTELYSAWNGDGPFRIFSCGRLNPCKGHDDLIRALAYLRNSGIDARLEIAGADDSMGEYLPVLDQLIGELGLRDSVVLLGAVSEDLVKGKLEVCHVFSLASLHEPLGVAIMEAMAMGLPVVVANSGGVAELVDDGVDGVLIKPRCPQELALSLKRIALDPNFAFNIGTAARRKIENSFTSDRSARVLAAHIETQ